MTKQLKDARRFRAVESMRLSVDLYNLARALWVEDEPALAGECDGVARMLRGLAKRLHGGSNGQV